jgi:methyltransferase (TIGR00027 family)
VSASQIAAANAMFRWAESRRGPSRILDDPWAGHLMDASARLAAIRYARFAVPALARTIDELCTAHCVRHRAIDELVCRAIEQHGCDQVVIVAAGYDMRASRFRDVGAGRGSKVRWFEIDHPATQARKIERLRGARDVNVDVVRAPIDLMVQDLGAVAHAAGVDPARPTVFVAEGIVHYLSLARLERLFAAVAGMRAPARLVFSYITHDAVARATPTFKNLVRIVREIPALSFTSRELAARAEKSGLLGFRDWGFEAQVADFAAHAVRRTAGLAQHVAEVEHAPRRAA